MLRLTCVFALCAALVAPSVADAARSRTANLDADAPWERVDIRGTQETGFRVFVVDRCGGDLVEHRVTGRWDSIVRLKVRELDGYTARPEVLVDARNGASGRFGTIKVLRLSGRGCPSPRTLFAYHSGHPAPPPDGWSVVSFNVRAGEYRADVPGSELRLWEGLFGPDDEALCCPSRVRVSSYLFSRSLGRYVRYASRIRDA